jgi:hypothetical protein
VPPDEPTLVGAVFPSRLSAADAAEALRTRGLADEHVATAVWSGDGYVIESPAGREVRDSLALGALLGFAIALVIGGTIGAVAWSSVAAWVAFGVSGVIAGMAGAVIGGYLGLNRHRPLLWDERHWAHIALEEGEVLVVVGVDRPEDTASTLQLHGGHLVQPVHPS